MIPLSIFITLSWFYRKGVLGFTQLDPLHLDASNFANSLIITRDDFSNYQHRDNDAIPVAYGLWWAGSKNGTRYSIDPARDHDKIRGGQFVFGEYGWGIDFERCATIYIIVFTY